MEPERPAALSAGERVDEDARAAEKHVPDATQATEAVVDVGRRGQELVLADLDRLARRQLQVEDVPDAVAAESYLPGAPGLGHEDRHPGNGALESALHGVHPDLERRRLPEQDVVLEVDRHGAVELHRQRRNQLAVSAELDARTLPFVDHRRQQLGEILGVHRSS